MAVDGQDDTRTVVGPYSTQIGIPDVNRKMQMGKLSLPARLLECHPPVFLHQDPEHYFSRRERWISRQ